MGGAWQEFERESRDSSRRLLVLVAVIAVVVLAALQYFGGAEHRESAGSTSEPVMLERRPEVAFQLGDRGRPQRPLRRRPARRSRCEAAVRYTSACTSAW